MEMVGDMKATEQKFLNMYSSFSVVPQTRPSIDTTNLTLFTRPLLGGAYAWAQDYSNTSMSMCGLQNVQNAIHKS